MSKEKCQSFTRHVINFRDMCTTYKIFIMLKTFLVASYDSHKILGIRKNSCHRLFLCIKCASGVSSFHLYLRRSPNSISQTHIPVL